MCSSCNFVSPADTRPLISKAFIAWQVRMLAMMGRHDPTILHSLQQSAKAEDVVLALCLLYMYNEINQ